MAIPKKGSRPITVDGSEYRWLVRRKPTYTQANGWTPMALAISSGVPRSSTLVATIAANRPDAWLNAGDKAITPRGVAALVRLAIAHGWNPSAPGNQFLLDVSLEELLKSEISADATLR